MKLVLSLVVFILLSAWVVNSASPAVPGPACTVTACNRSSECPQFNSFNQVVICDNGTCVGRVITFAGIGEECDVTSNTLLCRPELICSGLGLEDGVTVCQRTRTYGCACTIDAECEGGLCLNSTCDAIRSVGYACTYDEQCGSVCINSLCAAGSIGNKCNGDQSCGSGLFCAANSTCESDTREPCSAANPYNGTCSNTNQFCYEGKCYTRNGAVGSFCNTSVPIPHCKASLGCVNGSCAVIPEGTPCVTREGTCSALQDCVCNTNTNGYGCYTTAGTECTSAFQDYDDCLNACSEQAAVDIPGTCAYNCSRLRGIYECCVGCSTDVPIINFEGSCPNVLPTSCCSAVTACTTLQPMNVCPNVTASPTQTPTQPPTQASTPTPATTLDSTDNTGFGFQLLPGNSLLVFVVVGICCAWFAV